MYNARASTFRDHVSRPLLRLLFCGACELPTAASPTALANRNRPQALSTGVPATEGKTPATAASPGPAAALLRTPSRALSGVVG